MPRRKPNHLRRNMSPPRYSGRNDPPHYSGRRNSPPYLNSSESPSLQLRRSKSPSPYFRRSGAGPRLVDRTESQFSSFSRRESSPPYPRRRESPPASSRRRASPPPFFRTRESQPPSSRTRESPPSSSRRRESPPFPRRRVSPPFSKRRESPPPSFRNRVSPPSSRRRESPFSSSRRRETSPPSFMGRLATPPPPYLGRKENSPPHYPMSEIAPPHFSGGNGTLPPHYSERSESFPPNYLGRSKISPPHYGERSETSPPHYSGRRERSPPHYLDMEVRQYDRSLPRADGPEAYDTPFEARMDEDAMPQGPISDFKDIPEENRGFIDDEKPWLNSNSANLPSKPLSGAQRRKLRMREKPRRFSGAQRRKMIKEFAASYSKKKEKVQIKVAIVPQDFPSTSLTQEQFEDLQKALLAEIQPTLDGTGPQFHSCYFAKGAVYMSCKNEETKRWVEATVPKLKQWENLALTVRLAKYLDDKVKVVMITGQAFKQEKISKVLHLLKTQNTGLNTSNWHVINCIRGTKIMSVVIIIDQKSLFTLQQLEMKPCLGLGKARFKILDNKNPVVDEEELE